MIDRQILGPRALGRFGVGLDRIRRRRLGTPQNHRKEPLLPIMKSMGRAALATMFVYGGSATAREPGKRVKLLEEARIPHPKLAVRANGAAMTIAGGMLALGPDHARRPSVLEGKRTGPHRAEDPVYEEPGDAGRASDRDGRQGIRDTKNVVAFTTFTERKSL